MESFLDFVHRSAGVVLDGGLATELERRGLDLKDDLWSAKILIEHPEEIQRVHESYFRAGADVGTTATYQASLEGFQKRGLSERASKDLFFKAADLVARARAQVDGTRWIAASIGSYGAFLADGSEYRGQYNVTSEELRGFHGQRLRIFKEMMERGLIDVLAFETIPSLAEVMVIVRLLEEFQMGAWVSLSVKDETRLADGADLRDVAELLDACPWVWSLGVNCTLPARVLGALKVLGRSSAKPLVAYPNGGGTYDAEEKAWRGGREQSWVSLVKDWHRAGAKLVGGCCRTTPEEITEIFRWREGLPKEVRP